MTNGSTTQLSQQALQDEVADLERRLQDAKARLDRQFPAPPPSSAPNNDAGLSPHAAVTLPVMLTSP